MIEKSILGWLMLLKRVQFRCVTMPFAEFYYFVESTFLDIDLDLLQQVQSQNIHVGDIVRVKRDESFPCDLVLISTSNNEGKCYITTANLDGETNLKVQLVTGKLAIHLTFSFPKSDTLQP